MHVFILVYAQVGLQDMNNNISVSISILPCHVHILYRTLVVFAVWGLRIGSSINSVLDTSWHSTVLQATSLMWSSLSETTCERRCALKHNMQVHCRM